jgi:hypothetical protein
MILDSRKEHKQLDLINIRDLSSNQVLLEVQILFLKMLTVDIDRL